MIDIVEKNKCVGCKACGDICPVGAILYRIDEEGFWYPEINHEKCINCGLCKKVCPALCKFYPCLDMLKKPKTYKVYHKDRIIRYNSASGGLYHGIALAFLKNTVRLQDVYITRTLAVHTIICQIRKKIWTGLWVQNISKVILKVFSLV